MADRTRRGSRGRRKSRAGKLGRLAEHPELLGPYLGLKARLNSGEIDQTAFDEDCLALLRQHERRQQRTSTGTN